MLTSILVTHDQEEALEISDNIVLMNHGVIEQEGSGSALYHQPQTAFVTEFLGEASIFEGVIEDGAWRFNDFTTPLTAEQQQGVQAGPAKAYVRPHQWRLSRPGVSDDMMLQGRLEEVQDLGALVRLHVVDEAQAQAVDVFVPQQIQQQARYQRGEALGLSPASVIVFNS